MSLVRRAGCATLALGLLTALLAAAAPASAGTGAQTLGRFGDLKYVQEKVTLRKAEFLQESSRHIDVHCGKAWTPIGGGVFTGTQSDLAYLSWSEAGGAHYWAAEAWHTSAPKTKVTGRAICERKMDLSDDSHLVLVGAAPASSSGDIACSSGQLISGGMIAIGGALDWYVNGTLPIDDGSDGDTDPDDGWRVFMQHVNGDSSSFIVRAICTDDFTPDYRDKMQAIAVDTSLKVRATCKSGHVISGGGLLSGTTADAHIAATYPIDTGADKDSVPDDGWETRASNDNGTSKQLSTYAICS